MSIQFREILQLAALILSIVNALMLLRNYLRDRAILVVNPIHPEVYQWWFRLPEGESEGMPTRRYGFLLYVGVGNRGLRKAALKSWRLFIRTHARRSKQELKAVSIPEPAFETEGFTKVFPVLGQAGLAFKGETVVDAGCSIAGWVYYIAEYYGDERWNPIIRDGKVKGTFVVRDIFDGKAKTEITFSEQDLGFIKRMIPRVETIGQ